MSNKSYVSIEQKQCPICGTLHDVGILLDRRLRDSMEQSTVTGYDLCPEHKELHEVKKSKAVEDAGIWQVKYYLYYLWKRGVKGIKGKVDYPLLKKSVIVELSENDIKTLEKIIGEITEIECMDTPPMIVNSKLCKKCAYYDLCFI